MYFSFPSVESFSSFKNSFIFRWDEIKQKSKFDHDDDELSVGVESQ